MVPKSILTFASQFPVRRYSKGELILVEGEVPNSIFMVKQGVIKGYAITSDGVEKPIAFDTRGEIFPVGWAYGKIRASQFYYDAFTDVQVHCIPRDDYIGFLKKNPDVLLDVQNHLVGSYVFFQMRVNALERSKAIEKIIHTLHFLALRFGKEVAPNQVQITLPLSQQELANIMGLTRETTGIELNKLIKRGILKQDRQKNYTIYTDRLSQALDVDYGFGRTD